LILHDGQWYDDADAPYRAENAKRMPCSGAAIAPDGRLFLVEVDGRQPELSVGVKRTEFAALMRAFGATEGLLFDGGGSSTIVARRLGDREADVMNSPSDGRERPVADGLFVYSTARAGAPTRLVARPGIVRALVGSQIPLRIAAVDAANNPVENGGNVHARVSPASLGEFRHGDFIASRAGRGQLLLKENALKGKVPLEVRAFAARTRISPARPNVDPNGTIALTAHAYDSNGYALALPPFLPWRTSAGSIDPRGRYRAASHDARVSVRIGNAIAAARVTVGSHDVALPFAQHVRFTTHPHGGQGGILTNAGCGSCVQLNFAFSGNERAAYASADIPLPTDTIGIAFDLRDDGSSGRLRIAVRNALNEDFLLDATQLGEAGWRSVIVRFPPDIDAVRLASIYVLAAKGMELSNGSILLRNVRAVVAGR
jgi:hypothetical protein